ncbi:MAG: hypothetical protein IIY89_02180, partial [Clostridia bacterium]|nr:hypothetical protein [Clostridia bacterium]
NLELPGKVLFVNEAFNNCENLSKLKYSESTTISETAFLKCPKLVLEKEHNFIGKLLGWSAIILIMALAGYITFRVLTVMTENLKREKAREEKAARKPS